MVRVETNGVNAAQGNHNSSVLMATYILKKAEEI